MPSNNVGGVSVTVRLDDKDALQQLAALKKKIETLEVSLDAKRARKDRLETELQAASAAASRAREGIRRMNAELASADPSARGAIQARIAASTAFLNEQTAAAEKIRGLLPGLNEEIAAGESKLNGMRKQQENFTKQITDSRSAVGRLKTALSSVGQSLIDAFKKLGQMIKTIFAFQIVYTALRKLREYLHDVFLSFPEIRAVLADIKGNLLTALAPIVQALIPPLMTLLSVLRDVAAVLADIVSKIFGMTAAQAQDAAKGLNKQAEAYKKTGGAAAKASKQLASFDKLNILNDGSTGGGGGSGGGINPAFGTDFTNFLKDQLGAIELLLGTALLALGAILAFTGVNIPLGVTLMALGAAAIWAAMKMDWDELKRQLQGPIGKILAILSAALLVLGAILTFTGANIPLGIALMAIGAAGLATAIVANWDTIKQALQGTIGVITAIVSAALLVLGAVLTFSGANIPLGIGLMIAGAAGLAAVVVANWDTIKEKLQGPIGTITAIVSGALLVLGAILTFSGVNLPLGIGLLIAGAVGLAATAALNWDKIKALIQGRFGGILAIAAAGLLVLGIILTVAGILPLGIALIIAGAAGLVTVTALNWDSIKQKIVGVWDSIKQWWRANVAPVFTKEWWARLFNAIFEGINTAIGNVKKAFDSMMSYIKGEPYIASVEFTGPQGGTSISTSGSSHLSGRIPGIALGSVVPKNPQFAGATNSEDPVAAIADFLSNNGTPSKNTPIVVENRVFLDSREIQAGQQRLARVTGG